MKKKILQFAMLFPLAFWSFKCNEETVNVCEDSLLRFNLNVETIPLKSTLTKGDTLWVSLTIPEYLTDLTYNDDVQVLEYDFKIWHGLNRMDAPQTPSAYHEFDFVEKIGKYQIVNGGGGGEIARLTTEVLNGKQRLQIGFIPLNLGLFQMDFANLSAELKCQPLSAFGSDFNNLEITYTMNSGDLDENNYSLLLASPIAVTQPELISTPDVFLKAGVYVFQVVE